MILKIAFLIWFFLVVLILAFFRGSSRDTPARSGGYMLEEQPEDAQTDWDELQRRRRDTG